MSEGDLNPAATVLTTKEVLLEVRQDMKDTRVEVASVASSMSILMSQDLNGRLDKIESWKDKVDGRVNILIVLVTVVGTLLGMGLTVVTLLRLLFPQVPA